jgi:beta-phosphoglucomutase family hydrolase
MSEQCPLLRQDAHVTGARTQVVGLPDGIRACLFDLDGVLTKTAKVHAAAWKEMFDTYLRARSQRTGEAFVPFDAHHDYDRYVDGMPRYDGVRTFLASRSIELPEGDPSDSPGAETVCGLGNLKNELVLKMIREQGVEAYAGSVDYVHAVREAGLARAVVSSSANCKDVLVAAGIDDLFDEIVDGIVAREQNLKGKPAPDTFVYAARAFGFEPGQAAVFEDALAGVASGRAGNFGFVVGIDRVGQREALEENGADVVVDDLAELLRR